MTLFIEFNNMESPKQPIIGWIMLAELREGKRKGVRVSEMKGGGICKFW